MRIQAWNKNTKDVPNRTNFACFVRFSEFFWSKFHRLQSSIAMHRIVVCYRTVRRNVLVIDTTNEQRKISGSLTRADTVGVKKSSRILAFKSRRHITSWGPTAFGFISNFLWGRYASCYSVEVFSRTTHADAVIRRDGQTQLSYGSYEDTWLQFLIMYPVICSI